MAMKIWISFFFFFFKLSNIGLSSALDIRVERVQDHHYLRVNIPNLISGAPEISPL